MTSFQHFSKNSFSANGTERNGIERNGTKRNATEGTDILKKSSTEYKLLVWVRLSTEPNRTERLFFNVFDHNISINSLVNNAMNLH